MNEKEKEHEILGRFYSHRRQFTHAPRSPISKGLTLQGQAGLIFWGRTNKYEVFNTGVYFEFVFSLSLYVGAFFRMS